MSTYSEIEDSKVHIEGGEIFQNDLEQNFPLIIKNYKNAEENLNVVLIGAWRGEEIRSFLKWPKIKIFAFEPNPGNFDYLFSAFGTNQNIKCFQMACSDTDGSAVLFEANLTGNDSLLKIKERDGFKQVASHTVKTVRLDSVTEISKLDIDLLWIDVQGFEKYVLKGGCETLARTKAVFVELNDDDNAYQGATRIAELEALFETAGFYLAHREIGVDPVSNIKSGVGLFLKNTIKTDFFDQENIDVRSKKIISEIKRHHLMIRLGVYRVLGKLLPTSIKVKIKAWIS